MYHDHDVLIVHAYTLYNGGLRSIAADAAVQAEAVPKSQSSLARRLGSMDLVILYALVSHLAQTAQVADKETYLPRWIHTSPSAP